MWQHRGSEQYIAIHSEAHERVQLTVHSHDHPVSAVQAQYLAAGISITIQGDYRHQIVRCVYVFLGTQSSWVVVVWGIREQERTQPKSVRVAW